MNQKICGVCDIATRSLTGMHLKCLKSVRPLRRKPLALGDQCIRGHVLTKNTLYGSPDGRTFCRECRWGLEGINKSVYHPLIKLQIGMNCKHGHLITPEVFYVSPISGHTTCKVCRRMRLKKHRRVLKTLKKPYG